LTVLGEICSARPGRNTDLPACCLHECDMATPSPTVTISIDSIRIVELSYVEFSPPDEIIVAAHNSNERTMKLHNEI
jgi:hypothetical protein